MADALCGPSNALQNFQKHTSVDRTLQQDRLVGRQPPAQGFRSRNPNAGILDGEFEAFETNFAGNSASELEQVGPYVPPSHSHQLPRFPTAGTGDWASDFQRLQLSGPSYEGPQHQFRPGAPINKIATGGWQDEFVRQQQQQNSFQQSSHGSNFQSSFRQNYQMSGGMMQPLPAPQDTLQAPDQLQTETFDESAFEAAFEQARAEMELQESTAVEQQDVTERESLQTDTSLQREQTENIRIGSDLIVHDNQTGAQERRDDSDELAKTAGHLLDSVSHDQSRKFRDSSFLALMRRIRDREVQIEGDEFRETLQPLHPGGRYYPEGQTRSITAETQMAGATVTAGDISKFDDIEESSSLHVKFGITFTPSST